jgi:hypothetical protein
MTMQCCHLCSSRLHHLPQQQSRNKHHPAVSHLHSQQDLAHHLQQQQQQSLLVTAAAAAALQ